MAQAQKKAVQEDQLADRHGKHRFDQLSPRMAKHLVMFQPTEQIVRELVAAASAEIPGLTAIDEVLRIFRYNPEFIMALARKAQFDPNAPTAEGFIAILPLNMLGLQHLALGTINATNPHLHLLAKAGERPAGVYMWGVYAPGPLAAGVALFLERMNTPQYAGVNIYSRPNTDIGVRFNQVLGLHQGIKVGDIEAPDIWIFKRVPPTPLYDSYVPGQGKKEVGITVAHTFEDLMRVVAIRNAVYIGEQACPYEEEYDGNDLAATHLLAYIGDEPVGCMRMRCFADFVKFERMAIRKEFRKSRAASLLLQAALKLAQKKGYRVAYGHSQTRLVDFWRRFGFRPMEGAKPFVFSDYDYVEIVADIERDPDAVILGTDPYFLIRPEGRWHVPGILEFSAAREATNHSVAQNKSDKTGVPKPEVA